MTRRHENNGPINELLLAGMGVVLLTSSVTASAQTDKTAIDEDLIEEIVVTGSRIRRDSFETLQPATVLDQAVLESRGTLDIARVLNEQPAFQNSTTPIGPQGFQVGGNAVNLFGLGRERTLTLVNGLRVPPRSNGGTSVDLNTIPETLIERVETIAIGGAPIYGTDAIAGTVNIILKQDFEGREVFGSFGDSPEFNDARETRIGAVWGRNFGGGRSNLVVSAQMVSDEGLIATDRPLTATDPLPKSRRSRVAIPAAILRRPGHYRRQSYRLPLFFGDAGFANVFGNGIPFDLSDPSTLSQFDAEGNLQPFSPGGGTGSPVRQSGGDGLRLAEVTGIQPESDSHKATVLFRQDVSDTLTLRAELWYSRSKATQLTNQPTFNSPFFGGLPANNFGNVGEGPIPVLIDNPYLNPQARDVIQRALDAVQDFNGDGAADPTIDTNGDGVPDAIGFWRGGGLGGDNPNSFTQKNVRAVLSVAGAAELFDRDLRWDLSYTWGRLDADFRATSFIRQNFEQAIQVATDSDGNPACLDSSGGCAPFNVLGTPSDEALSFVASPVVDRGVNEQRTLVANLDGTVFDLPAGPLKAAVGFAYREESSSFRPNDLAAAGLVRSRNQRPPAFKDGYSSTELYMETVVPLLGDNLNTQWPHELTFEGAARFVSNSIAGDDVTWTAGLRYKMLHGLEFRGNVTRSVRAPSISELFAPEEVVGGGAADPCDARFIDAGPSPELRRQNCAQAGIVQPFQSVVVDARRLGTSAGNPDLDAEVADSYTYGLVFQPDWINGFSASVDWLNIEINDAIVALELNDLMQTCFDSPEFPEATACGSFSRDAEGQLDTFNLTPLNLARINFSGLQTVLRYATPLGRFGFMNVNLAHLYTHERELTESAGEPIDRVGEVGDPAHRVTASASWSLNQWTWFNQLRWIDSGVFDNTDDEFTRDVRGVDDWVVVNSSIVFSPNDRWSLQLVVDNLFDVDPPFAALAGAGLQTYYPGVAGRYVRLQTRFQF